MSNPTSNFGWQMPTPTDLVTDLPADFEVFGQAVDSSMADLKGGTSGQILSKATNTDMDFTWIDNQVGDITAVTADSPLTGGGTTGAISIGIQDGTTAQKGAVQLTDSTSSTSTTTAATPKNVKAAYDLAGAAIPASTATTAGDLLYRDGSAVTRLGIGTAGQVLKVNSGATAPEWGAAGGASALVYVGGASFTSSSGQSLNNVFTSTYQNYMIIVNLAKSDLSTTAIRLRASGTDNSSTNYYSESTYNQIDAGGGQADVSNSGGTAWLASDTGNLYQVFHFMNPQATLNTFWSAEQTAFNYGLNFYTSRVSGLFNATTSFDGFTVYPTIGTMTGNIRVYGIANS